MEGGGRRQEGMLGTSMLILACCHCYCDTVSPGLPFLSAQAEETPTGEGEGCRGARKARLLSALSHQQQT